MNLFVRHSQIKKTFKGYNCEFVDLDFFFFMPGETCDWCTMIARISPSIVIVWCGEYTQGTNFVYLESQEKSQLCGFVTLSHDRHLQLFFTSLE